MPMPAALAWRSTVASSQRSVWLRGSVITTAPVERLAIHLDSSSEMKEPPKPKMPAMISRPLILLGSVPNSDITMLARISTAKFVARKRAIRVNMGKSGSERVDIGQFAVWSA
ncbi:hypothetical protein G6F50_013724 [Rhizopus delemar]|uniref:Uncharacterized protein n=1 Tax=Rhizopus delemar TaxID=936053 RepID=A0A9P6YE50_9FUNG|nr:hypothetical protein G6F50_013724 [Rhizopus delemar]